MKQIQKNQWFAVLMAVLLFSLTVSGGWWLGRPGPAAQVLSVEFVNAGSRDISRIEIQHGNDNTEERIVLLRLARGDRRAIGLNHQPGKGFSMTVVFADGEQFEVCAGKMDEAWYLSLVIKDDDLLTVAGPWKS